MTPTRVTRSIPLPEDVQLLVEADLFPLDPEPVESTPPEPDHIEGLSLRMTQAMNHYQKQECCCFMCGDTGHFMQGTVHIAKPSAHGTRSI